MNIATTDPIVGWVLVTHLTVSVATLALVCWSLWRWRQTPAGRARRRAAHEQALLKHEQALVEHEKALAELDAAEAAEHEESKFPDAPRVPPWAQQ